MFTKKLFVILLASFFQTALAIASSYILKVEVSPLGGGALNKSFGEAYEEGSRIYLSTRSNTGFVFKGWFDGDSLLSKTNGFYYTMPSKDIVIKAKFEFDPVVPVDPDSIGTVRTITLESKPAGGGTFNNSMVKAVSGDKAHLFSYTNPGFRFLRWEDESGNVLSDKSDCYYVVPAHDSKVYGIFQFDPAVPDNPMKNYWNEAEGQAIISDFSKGRLIDAMAAAINGSSNDKVAMITVSGQISNNDFGIVNNYTNCTLIDLCRTSGVNEVPSYAFDGTNLEGVYLPSSIDKIGSDAFYNCKKLGSLTIYAMTPPTLDSNVFTGVPDGLVVYVPAGAITNYQNAEIWKDFTIVPIQEDIRSLTVNLPKNTDASDFKGMWLEIANTRSGQRMHYVLTDRDSYSFRNLIRNTTWNVYLRNQQGDIFGQIERVDVNDNDTTVSFSSLEMPQDVSITVVLPDGTDVTSQITATWTDNKGNYISQGEQLEKQAQGGELICAMTLPQQLAMSYQTPDALHLTVGSNNIVTCTLTPIPQVILQGKVVDATTGQPISGAVVSASQTFVGKYSRTTSASTDNNGFWTLSASAVPTSITFASSDYISQTVVCDSLMHSQTSVAIPDVALKTITGAVINLSLNYTRSINEGEQAETQNWYSDYQNVSYSIYDSTKGKTITQFNVQYPRIVLLEEVDDGDELALTATSRTNSFMPVSASTMVNSQSADATFSIVQLGSITATFAKNSNASVNGSLYNCNDKLIKNYTYSNGSLTISDLQDGQYTLVTMAASQFLNSIGDLSQYAAAGLTASDYAVNTVQVKSGVVSNVSIDEVPTLDESRFSYTGTGTSFTVNKSSIVVGNYLTLTGKVNFKQTYASKISYVNLIVDLPENCSFVENSVMVGNSTSGYSLDGNRITIPMIRYTDRVRFCVIPTLGGDYQPSAMVQFDMDGQTISQPIGSANYTANNLSINVPSTVAKTTVPVSGTAQGRSTIEIYDNDMLVGQTTSLANGTWSTKVELNDAYNLSTHMIYAKATTKSGIALSSETKSCIYDKNTIEVNTVTMINTAHTSANLELYDYVTVFDFQNQTTSASSYWYWPQYPTFTFLLDFTDNDTTRISDVALHAKTSGGLWHTFAATYDTIQKKWVAKGMFNGGSDLPVNVNVTYNSNSPAMIDADELRRNLAYYDEIQKKLMDESARIDVLFSSANKDSINAYMSDIGLDDDYFLQFVNRDSLDNELNSMSQSDLDAYFEKLSEEMNADSAATLADSYINSFVYDENWTEIRLGDYITRRTPIVNVDSLSLASEGFEAYVCTDNSLLFIKSTEDSVKIIDTKNGYLYTFINTSKGNSLAKANYTKSEESLSAQLKEWTENIDECLDDIKTVVENFHKSVEDVLGPITKQQAKLGLDKAHWVIAKKKCPTAWLHVCNQKIEEIDKTLARLRTISRGIRQVAKVADKYMPVVKYAFVASDAVTDLTRLVRLHNSVPNPCEEDAENAAAYKSEISNKAWGTFGYYIGYLSFDISASIASAAQKCAAIPTGGTSIVTGILTDLAAIGAEFCANYIKDKVLSVFMSDMTKKVSQLKCSKKYDEDDDNLKKPSEGDYCYAPDIQPVLDPSGYVYESVPSNRLEGVTATMFYKENVEDMYGDLHENIVKWDAEEYAQKNPLFTDENGMYRWDVPEGLWQVKFEKEGYETAYSEWLPVPPPQLDVNIGMKQNTQPNVIAARAYEDAVEVEFDKYMNPEWLTTEQISVLVSNQPVEGSITLKDQEIDDVGNGRSYARKLRFNATKPFNTKEVTLNISNRVRSYAGIRMQDDYSQTFSVEQEITSIDCDSSALVAYGGEASFVISVKPATAAAGKTLRVQSSSSMIASVETEVLTLDKNGQATIKINGLLPGIAGITITIDGTDVTSVMPVKVVPIESMIVANPTVDVASGSELSAGSAVYLSCATEGATIYYTLDGSCPCDNTALRFIYDGNPIIINENTVIKAIATKTNWYDSEVMEFDYTVTGINLITIKKNDKEKFGKTYNLQGQKINDIKQKGVYIINGEKIFVK